MPRISDKLSPGLGKIVRNVGWLSLEKALSMILNLTIGIYLIRYLGSNDFGKLSYCLSIVGCLLYTSDVADERMVV
jgi:O-antigen/teichoic acid export membrane protein